MVYQYIILPLLKIHAQEFSDLFVEVIFVLNRTKETKKHGIRLVPPHPISLYKQLVVSFTSVSAQMFISMIKKAAVASFLESNTILNQASLVRVRCDIVLY